MVCFVVFRFVLFWHQNEVVLWGRNTKRRSQTDAWNMARWWHCGEEWALISQQTNKWCEKSSCILSLSLFTSSRSRCIIWFGLVCIASFHSLETSMSATKSQSADGCRCIFTLQVSLLAANNEKKTLKPKDTEAQNAIPFTVSKKRKWMGIGRLRKCGHKCKRL